MKNKNNGAYDWKFCTIGGVTRINLTSGEDIKHLGELDPKLWTVLSCPVNGLELDSTTLKMIDTNNDGSIHIDEVVAASQWLVSAIKDPELLMNGGDALKISDIDKDNETGAKLYDSAVRILSSLGKDGQESICVEESSNCVEAFAKTIFNGDGIITEATASSEGLQELAGTIISTMGAKADRSGDAGMDAESIEGFYAACADYSAWIKSSEADKESIFPYGDRTEEALGICESLEAKVADFFMRCKLAAFDSSSCAALDVSAEKISEISGRNLAQCAEDIAALPLARVNAEGLLPKDGINPAWAGAFATLGDIVLSKLYPDDAALNEEQWSSILGSFAAYKAWKGAKAGAAVEGLGIEKVDSILADGRKEALLSLVERDAALSSEAEAIDSVNKLTHLYRDFAKLLKNFVVFSDFYSRDPEKLAVFQAGRLYIDQRSCDLCIKVSDMGKHTDMAGLSGMYILYCLCSSAVKGETMTIAAVMTDGDVRNLREGKNAIFYDRDGLDWGATVIKIIENPISIRQAFWTPYRKLGRFIENTVTKMASDKDDKMTAGLQEKAAAAPEGAKQPFDIAKFAGIFAAIGLAVGALGAALAALLKGIIALKWWQILLVIAAILLIISAPAMILAWLKIRRRNLSPVLNANGWAINSEVIVNRKFGSTLTTLAKFPKTKFDDPFTDKTPAWKKWLFGIIGAIIVAAAVLFFTDNLACIGLPYHKEAPVEETVEVVEEVVEEPVEEVVETAEAAE